MSNERLVVPANDPSLTLALESFKESILGIATADREDIIIEQAEHESIKIGHLSLMQKGRIQARNPGIRSLHIWMQVPGTEFRVPYHKREGHFIKIKSSVSRTIRPPEEISRDQSFVLSSHQAASNNMVSLSVQRRDRTSCYTSSRNTYKGSNEEFEIQSFTELGQRLNWAVHFVDVILNPDKYPKTQLLI